VLADLAVMIADGGETISDLAVLRDQPALFGEVASHATAWRALDAVDDTALERIKTARAEARAVAWAMGADPGAYVIDIDAALVGSHADKEGAAPTYKRGFGFHPLEFPRFPGHLAFAAEAAGRSPRCLDRTRRSSGVVLWSSLGSSMRTATAGIRLLSWLGI
jgi:hypothetical protein